MAITLRSGTPKLPQAIAFDCYRTLFDNSHEDWKTTFDEIIKTQKLPLTAEELEDAVNEQIGQAEAAMEALRAGRFCERRESARRSEHVQHLRLQVKTVVLAYASGSVMSQLKPRRPG